MDLGVVVLDKQLLDSDSHRCGKVDDLLLETEDDRCLAVKGILTQPGALARDIGPRAFRFVRRLYRVLGIRRPEAVFVAWEQVRSIDVVVHLASPRRELNLGGLEDAIARRFIGKIPGA